MPKLKTHKGAAKRLKLSKTGKLLRMQAGHNHFRAKNRSSQNSDFRHTISGNVKSTIKLIKRVVGKIASK
ncbi:MAG: 50S ribosomal protein L35 [Chloroflexota bacterium]|nr:50S ribosomal protein L35 [Chloroflexota bacterium]